MKSQRDATLDVVRGLGIATMVFGHLAIEVVVPPGGFYIEAIGGLAPALFVGVSGMVVAQAAFRRDHGLRRPLLRGAELLVMAVALDLAFWRIFPFTTVDVLYLIAISLPLGHLVATRLPVPARWALGAFFLLAAPPLQGWLGYCDYPTEYALDGELLTEVDLPGVGIVPLENQTPVWQHWLVDGWFPLFPWLGFSLLGVAAASLRWRGGELQRFGLLSGLLPGVGLVGVALQLGWLDVGYELTPRRFYAGAFMPPGYGYLIGSLGVIAIALFLVDLRPSLALWRFVGLIGRNSLLIYVVHLPAIRVLSTTLEERVSHPAYLLLYAILVTLLALLAAAIEMVPRRGRNNRHLAPPPGIAIRTEARPRDP